MEFYARLSCMPASQYGSSLEIKIECTPRGCEKEGRRDRSVWDDPRGPRQSHTFILLVNNCGNVGKARGMQKFIWND